MQIPQLNVEPGLSSAQSWEVDVVAEFFKEERTDLIQLTPASRPHEVRLLRMQNLSLRHVVQGAGWAWTAAWQPQTVTAIIYLEPPSESYRAGGERVPEHGFLWYAGAQQHFSFAPEPNEFVCITMRKTTLNRVVEGTGGSALLKKIPAGPVVRTLPATLEDLAGALRETVSMEPGGHPGRESEITAKFVRTLTSGMSGDASEGQNADALGHQRVVSRCREYLEKCLTKPVYLEDLCKASRCSERTVEQAFMALLGITPINYVRLRRLGLVRSTLMSHSTRNGSVKRAALEAGFCDMARFAGDYRRVFGERPSATLRRSGGTKRAEPEGDLKSVA